MPKWFFSKDRLLNRTPSRANGVDFPTECRYRREGCRFIMDMGNKLGLRYDTMATGVIYFHRFYMKQSYKSFPRWVTACACLFLAGKVEETPKKCRDIIKVARMMLSDHHFQLFGENPREEVMVYERVLLQTIKFDLQVEHPYSILLKIGKLLKGDKGKIQKLVQMAWTFVNDSLATSLSLRKRPEVLAIAHLNLAGKLANFDMKTSTDAPSSKPWWYSFNKECHELVIEEICNEMLELYGANKKDKPPKKSASEKTEPSPTNSSSHSSPSVTNSPPFKKKKLDSKDGKSIQASMKTASNIGPRPMAVSANSGHTIKIIMPGLPSVDNISPVVTSENAAKTTAHTLHSNMANVPPVPGPLVHPTVPFGSPVLPQYLSSTFSPVPFGVPPPKDSTIPTATSGSATLLAPPGHVPQVGVQKPPGFIQTFTHVAPQQTYTPPPTSYMQAQPPPSHHPPTHVPTQPPPPPIQTHHPSSHLQVSHHPSLNIPNQPPPTHIQSQPPLESHPQSSTQTFTQHPPLPPHKLFPSMHHASQQSVPPPMSLIPGAMNTTGAPPGNNNPNWLPPNYSRPPNTQPMGRGGWMR